MGIEFSRCRGGEQQRPRVGASQQEQPNRSDFMDTVKYAPLGSHPYLATICQEDISVAVFFIIVIIIIICFLGLHPRHMEVSRLWVESELPLLATATPTATWDMSRICDLHQSSWQHQILSPLSEARDRTHILMGTSQIRFHCATTGTPWCL